MGRNRRRRTGSLVTVSTWGRSLSTGRSEFTLDNHDGYEEEEDEEGRDEDEEEEEEDEEDEGDEEEIPAPPLPKLKSHQHVMHSDEEEDEEEESQQDTRIRNWFDRTRQDPRPPRPQQADLLPSPPLSPPPSRDIPRWSPINPAQSSRSISPSTVPPPATTFSLATESSGGRTPRAGGSPIPRRFWERATSHQPAANFDLAVHDSEIIDHLAEGVASLTVAMAMDEAGRWRIKRRSGEENYEVDDI